MASEQPSVHEANLARTQPPYPTYEEMDSWPDQWVRPTLTGLMRLFWTLDGPLNTSIGVFDVRPEHGPTTSEPFYDAATDTYHAVAAMPATEPRASSVTVHVNNLADWEDAWEDFHWKHSHPDEIEQFQGCAWGMVDGELCPVLCCGETRPRNKDVSIVVRPAVADDSPDGGGYVTVLDYVTTVHPWLMGLRSDLLNSLVYLDPPRSADTPLVVDKWSARELMVSTRQHWQISNHGRVPMSLIEGYGGVVRV